MLKESMERECNYNKKDVRRSGGMTRLQSIAIAWDLKISSHRLL